jgi:hypothetical protein
VGTVYSPNHVAGQLCHFRERLLKMDLQAKATILHGNQIHTECEVALGCFLFYAIWPININEPYCFALQLCRIAIDSSCIL